MYKGGELPSWPIVRCDGTMTPNQSVYTPRGEWKRRMIFDMLGIRSITNMNKSVMENREYLDNMRVNAADALIQLKVTDIKEEVRSERLPYNEIQELAQGIQQYTDQAKYERSLHAYKAITRELEQTNLSRTFKEDGENVEIVGRGKRMIPRTIVFAFELAVKLEQVLIAKELDLSEVPMMSKRLVDHFDTLHVRHVFRVTPKDVLHLFDFDDLDEELIADPMLVNVLSKVRLNSNMEMGSQTWLLYVLLGTINMRKSIVARELGWLRGKYGNFKMDDERIRIGYEVMWRSHRNMMSDYFTMIGASSELRMLMTAAYQYADEQGTYKYQYIQPSRNNFFISDDPASCVRNVDIRVEVTPMKYALCLIYGYLHMISHISSITCRQKLWVSPLLDDYVVRKVVHKGVRD